MVGKRKLFFGVVFAFLAGCAVGPAIGGHQGFRFGTSAVMNGVLSRDAREVETRIAILGHLRSGEQDKAIEKLEMGLADTLIGFDPVEPYADLNRQTVAALKQAIDEAKRYWSAHPRRQNNFRDNMVDSLFARELYR